MADKSKIPNVILETDSLNEGNTIPKGSIIITAPKKKKAKPGGQQGKPMSRGVKQALRGGGRAYGQNS